MQSGQIVTAWLSQLGRRAGRLGWLGLDLVCPPRCVFCRTDVPDPAAPHAVVCGACRQRLACDLPRCPSCGSLAAPTAGCRCCRTGRARDWDGMVVLASYADDARDLVLAAKRPGSEPIAAGLAWLLIDRHRAQLNAWQLDAVVPVPMHWSRRLARGTSAADSLARGVAAGLALPCGRLLTRIRPTRMQNELPPEDRRTNVRGAFRGSRAAAGRRLLVVDDVATTGGTLAACRRALTEAGAAAVYVAVVARAEVAEPGTD